MTPRVEVLEALADLADDPDDARRYLELRDALCPEGLKGIIKSYVDEAGTARLLHGRSRPDHRLISIIASAT